MQHFLPAGAYLPAKGFPFSFFVCLPPSVLKRYRLQGFTATVVSPLPSRGGGFQPCPQQRGVFLTILLRRIISSLLLENFCRASLAGCWDARRPYPQMI